MPPKEKTVLNNNNDNNQSTIVNTIEKLYLLIWNASFHFTKATVELEPKVARSGPARGTNMKKAMQALSLLLQAIENSLKDQNSPDSNTQTVLGNIAVLGFYFQAYLNIIRNEPSFTFMDPKTFAEMNFLNKANQNKPALIKLDELFSLIWNSASNYALTQKSCYAYSGAGIPELVNAPASTIEKSIEVLTEYNTHLESYSFSTKNIQRHVSCLLASEQGKLAAVTALACGKQTNSAKTGNERPLEQDNSNKKKMKVESDPTSPNFIHRFQFATEKEIGSISITETDSTASSVPGQGPPLNLSSTQSPKR